MGPLELRSEPTNRISLLCGAQPAGELVLTGALTEKFNLSYENLLRNHQVSYLKGGFGSVNVPPEPALTFGTHRSPLVGRIRKSPWGQGRSREQFTRIFWIDADVPCYGTYRGKHHIYDKDHPDFRALPLAGRQESSGASHGRSGNGLESVFWDTWRGGVFAGNSKTCGSARKCPPSIA